MAENTKYLLDTHTWLWWHLDPDKLGSRAYNIIEDGSSNIYFSVVSAWEIVIKHGLQKLSLPLPPREYVPKRLEKSYMDILQIQLAHVLHIQKLPQHHKDPFDRLLIAQAQTEKLTLISCDQQFEPYELDLIW